MSEMPIEQTVGVDENEALREKIGDITLDSDQVQFDFLNKFPITLLYIVIIISLMTMLYIM